MALKRDFSPVTADDALEDDCRQLVRLAVREDLGCSIDWTSASTIPPERRGRGIVVPRGEGIAAGLVTLAWIVDEMEADLQVELLAEEGSRFTAGEPLARIEGNVRDLLACERIVLNLVSRLCGIATLTQRFVAAVEGTAARLYDTRKTTPGLRRLEKYAVRCGGGHNHRTGLFDAFLIKDNHLAWGGHGGEREDTSPHSAAEAVRLARSWAGGDAEGLVAPQIVEVEVDRLDQLRDVLPEGPDIVLLDNFTLDQLRQAVALRDEQAPEVELEASGGVRIDTIGEIARTGVERISCGALTHQATSLDLGLDWEREPESPRRR